MAKEILERKEVPKEYTWDLESMFSTVEDWEKEYSRVEKLAEEFEKHKGELAKSSKNLLQALKDGDDLFRAMSNVYAYTHMKLDEDTTNSKSQSLSDKSLNLYVKVEENHLFST